MAFPDAAPAYLKGKMEVRGLGIVSVPNEEDPVFLNLVVQSGRLAELERLPETTFARFCDVAVQIVELSLLEASATAKVRLALSRGPDDIIPAP
jgi:serine kinase of HPr protein (carbohydrate metabolism regulator)